jgi:hypothetical protein
VKLAGAVLGRAEVSEQLRIGQPGDAAQQSMSHITRHCISHILTSHTSRHSIIVPLNPFSLTPSIVAFSVASANSSLSPSKHHHNPCHSRDAAITATAASNLDRRILGLT